MITYGDFLQVASDILIEKRHNQRKPTNESYRSIIKPFIDSEINRREKKQLEIFVHGVASTAWRQYKKTL